MSKIPSEVQSFQLMNIVGPEDLLGRNVSPQLYPWVTGSSHIEVYRDGPMFVRDPTVSNNWVTALL